MNPEKIINYNGQLISDQPLFSINNRAFRYGDALFETIRIFKGKAIFCNEHFQRLIKGMEILKMNVPSFMNIDWLEKETSILIYANKISHGGRLRLTVFRKDGGLYTPETNDVDYIIEATPIAEEMYVLNEAGFKIDLFNDYKKPLNKLSIIKSTNCQINILAGIFRKENTLDDCLILNETGNIAEAISSNIFIVKKNEVITPSLDQGCVEGVMRQQIISLLKKNNIAISETIINTDALNDGDEIFLTNVISGVRWVGAFRNKIYKKGLSYFICETLNTLIQ